MYPQVGRLEVAVHHWRLLVVKEPHSLGSIESLRAVTAAGGTRCVHACLPQPANHCKLPKVLAPTACEPFRTEQLKAVDHSSAQPSSAEGSHLPWRAGAASPAAPRAPPPGRPSGHRRAPCVT